MTLEMDESKNRDEYPENTKSTVYICHIRILLFVVKLPKQNLVVVATAKTPLHQPVTWPSLDQGRMGVRLRVPQRHTFARRKETWSGGDLDLHFCHHFSSFFFHFSLQKLAI